VEARSPTPEPAATPYAGSGTAAAGIRVDPNGGADHDDINLTGEGYTAIDAIDKQLSITN
jgi:hypothetical protein